MRWDDDDTFDKSEFRTSFPDVKNPQKRISGWRKSLRAGEEKAAKRKAEKQSERSEKKKKKN